jgi:hypothetical protein
MNRIPDDFCLLHGCDSMNSDRGPIPYCSRCERMDELTRVAVALGIKLARAEEGTDQYECWADRVREAEMRDQQYRRWSLFDTCEPLRIVDFAQDKRREAIAEASRYAIGGPGIP